MKRGGSFRERDIIKYGWRQGTADDERRIEKIDYRKGDAWNEIILRCLGFFIGNMDSSKSF